MSFEAVDAIGHGHYARRAQQQSVCSPHVIRWNNENSVRAYRLQYSPEIYGFCQRKVRRNDEYLTSPLALGKPDSLPHCRVQTVRSTFPENMCTFRSPQPSCLAVTGDQHNLFDFPCSMQRIQDITQHGYSEFTAFFFVESSGQTCLCVAGLTNRNYRIGRS
jgi:hypothetical protein